MSYIVLPISPPISFGGTVTGKITLPVTLPLTFSGGATGTITLPVTLPLAFGGVSKERKSIKLPIAVTCEYANLSNSIKLPLSENTIATTAKLPLQETSWAYYGLIIEETIISELSKSLILMEDIRSRILMDVEMLNGTEFRVKWFGDEVPAIEIHKKMSVDEVYEKVGTYSWAQESAVIVLGNSEYDVKLLGTNSTGESYVTSIGETTFVEADVTVEIPINEKIYDFDINYISTYRIEINY